MPKKLERALRREANKHKDWDEDRKDRYVYESLRKTGWVPSTQKKHKSKSSKKKKKKSH